MTHQSVDWSEFRDIAGRPGDQIAALLDSLEQEPNAGLWRELGRRLVVETECFCSAGFAALPRLSLLAEHGTEEYRDTAIKLASMIAMTLHRHHRDDDLVRAEPAALATLHRLTRSRLPSVTGSEFRDYFQAALAFAGYVFWATISLDYSDEHYRIGCPHCSTRIVVVIGDYGHYSAIRDEWAGDVQRIPLDPAEPAALDGLQRWMYDTAVACGDPILAGGLTYLFGNATCPNCGSVFNIAEWYEAENGPTQPIDPVVPRVDRAI
ncbi:hypothetical protein AB0J86_19575 [Micromonospora sp. NPDC049559]|uniref:hypothetical protein n=1 Tax=Micromonospora sp. NPDC049559 TaxID=3155923 RepID=UPI0034159046